MKERWFTVGEVATRTGVATSALRFYEERGLIRSVRTDGNQRRYEGGMIRRVSFILAAQRVGLTLEEIASALASLPNERTPTKADWGRLSRSWAPRIDERIEALTKLRGELTECIGCGCLSLKTCALYNPDDRAATLGQGPRYLLGNRPEDIGVQD